MSPVFANQQTLSLIVITFIGIIHSSNNIVEKMKESRNLENFVEKKLYECKKKYVDIAKDEGQRFGKHYEALTSKIFEILRKENPELDIIIAEFSLEGKLFTGLNFT